VGRATGSAMLVHLPDGYKTEHVVPAIATKIKTLPVSLRRSPISDQGIEMRE
jgi:transposase, IS30 family